MTAAALRLRARTAVFIDGRILRDSGCGHQDFSATLGRLLSDFCERSGVSTAEKSPALAREPDFVLGRLKVSPSTCRVTSDSDEIRVEAQTMSVLIALSRAQGATVSKADLIEACWQGRVVSDDAVTRTIAKVRALARATTPDAFVLETLPKVGYRLSALTDTATQLPASVEAAAHPAPEAANPWISRQWRAVTLIGTGIAGIVLAVLLASGARALFPGGSSQSEMIATAYGVPIRSVDVTDALLNVDEQRLKLYIQHGWNVNWHLDSESNGALHTLMMACERNPTHDKAAVLRSAQILVRAGADVNAKNGWGDTPVTIAKANRYCGPGHPVTMYLRDLASKTK